MGSSRSGQPGRKKIGPRARTDGQGTLSTLFGQPIAEPLRHLVGQYPLPARLNEFHLRRLRTSKKVRLFPKGTILFEQGELPAGTFIILEGRVKKSVSSPQGKALVLGFFGSGSALGLAVNILGRPHNSTAEAIQATKAVFVPRRELIKEMQDNSLAAWQIAQLVSESCCFLTAKIGSVELAESATQKMARCLLGLVANSSADGNDGPVQLDLNQETIAQMVGLSRETACRLLSRFRRAGVLDWTRSSCVIHDRQALEELADFAV